MAGKKRRAVDVANEDALGMSAAERKRSRKEEERIRRGVDEYTVRLLHFAITMFLIGDAITLQQKLRGPSLLEQHAAQKKPEDEDESKKVIWDHARDMAIGGRLMDDDKRNQMIRESKGLGERFGSGKGGSFL